ncbi:MAG: hypothetical protein JXQ75_12905 [Phycisphaerae bacterium]|nr:hypothetical protein [Phycisphaerae bacterium]
MFRPRPTPAPARASIVLCFCTLLLGLPWTGCGFERIHATLPAAVSGLTLEQLEDIQDDERLTDDEKRERIRETVEAPDSESGDRLVEFLLTFNVP